MPYDKATWRSHPIYLRRGDALTADIDQQVAALGLSVSKYLLLLARAAMRARQGDTSGLVLLGITSPFLSPGQPPPTQPNTTEQQDNNALLDALSEDL